MVGDRYLIILRFQVVKDSIKCLSNWVQPAVIKMVEPKFLGFIERENLVSFFEWFKCKMKLTVRWSYGYVKKSTKIYSVERHRIKRYNKVFIDLINESYQIKRLKDVLPVDNICFEKCICCHSNEPVLNFSWPNLLVDAVRIL